VATAIHSDWSGSRKFYIADNEMIGRRPPELMGWFNVAPWNEHPDFAEKRLLDSYYAVSIYGAGHVIAYNRVVGFHDALDHATYGMPDGYPNTPRDRMPVSIDIYGNDVSNLDDNCFEADGSMHNVRIFDNRCFNVGVGGGRLNAVQRQKLALARALLKRSDLLVVNEALSVLDGAGQNRLVERILDLCRGKGVIWTLQRPEMAVLFDSILVMGDGRLVEQGSYDELTRRDSAFKGLVAAE